MQTVKMLVQQIVFASRPTAIHLPAELPEAPEDHALVQFMIGHHVYSLRSESALGSRAVVVALTP